MGNIISSFLSPESIRSALSSVAEQAKYIWDLKANLEVLETAKEKLGERKRDVANKVEVEEKQDPRTRRTNTVEGWLRRVEEKLSEVEKLQQQGDQEMDRLCLGGLCSKDLVASYKFGKKVLVSSDEVNNMRIDGEKFQQFTEMVAEGPAVALALEQTIIGQESLLGRVWGCVTDREKIGGIIGLYGKGGVGKTTLLKQVNNNFGTQQHHFDVVIWVIVSREPKPEKIQDDIGKRIGCFSDDSWKNKSRQDKASDISGILSRRKFVLLLDDIWQSIDLIDLGIPLQSLKFGSKIVFTTRYLDVCGRMKAGENIEVSCLGDDEAWKLFQEEVGRYALDGHPDIPKLAKTMARECHGLPLALKTVGQVMASISNPEEWKSKIDMLRTSASRFSDLVDKVFSCLKFSYDSLPNNQLRSCLLYCCLFPEDSEIPKTDLIEYWKSEGFLDASNGGWDVVGRLHRACLLEEDGDCVKIHDLIREMGLWIAGTIEKEETVLVRTGPEAPTIEEWEGVKRISLMASKIKGLPEIPNCPRLQTLLLNDNEVGMIADGFFQFLHSLKVLSLRNTRLTKLPSGISSSSLVHLDLSWTNISELPQELKTLVNLRYLNLESTHKMSRIPRQLISGFSKLEVLLLMFCRALDPIHKEVIPSEDVESLIKELLCLKHLNHISLTLNGSHAVNFFLKSPKLLNITRSLSIRNWESPPLINVLHVASMEHLKEFHIDRSNLENLKIDSTGEVAKVRGFRSLHRVRITSCYNMKHLTWLVFAPNLKKLTIFACDDMEEIVSVEKWSEVSEIMGELKLFAQLEVLQLRLLANLKSIYLDHLSFPKLKKIEVNRCRKLKKLPLNSSRAKERQIIIMGNKKWWEELQWEDEATQMAFSSCFVEILPHRLSELLKSSVRRLPPSGVNLESSNLEELKIEGEVQKILKSG